VASGRNQGSRSFSCVLLDEWGDIACIRHGSASSTAGVVDGLRIRVKYVCSEPPQVFPRGSSWLIDF
jgi:hypothetical protein